MNIAEMASADLLRALVDLVEARAAERLASVVLDRDPRTHINDTVIFAERELLRRLESVPSRPAIEVVE